jgi:hypothetical protein
VKTAAEQAIIRKRPHNTKPCHELIGLDKGVIYQKKTADNAAVFFSPCQI